MAKKKDNDYNAVPDDRPAMVFKGKVSEEPLPFSDKAIKSKDRMKKKK
jgi:hypothetical protein